MITIFSAAVQCCNIIPIFRGYNTDVSDHFYTTDLDELKNAPGYVSEGTTGYIFPNQRPQTVPFYRLYQSSSGDHFYTINQAEMTNALSNLGFVYEGFLGYVYPPSANRTSLRCGAAPLYRLYSGAAGDHFYTMSKAERNSVLGAYTDEGVAGYILPG